MVPVQVLLVFRFAVAREERVHSRLQQEDLVVLEAILVR